MSTLTEIIVTGYGLPELESKCITSIIKNTKEKYILSFVDNSKSGMSLTNSWNNLISRTKADYICLLNNDTEVSPSWLGKLLYPFSKIDHLGFTGPSTNNCKSVQNQITSYQESQKNNEVQLVRSHLSGFCLVFPKKLWERLGGFDENFDFYGNETDLIQRAHNLGYKSAWVKGSFVYHVGEASIKSSGKNIKRARDRGIRLYHAKHKLKGG